MPTCTCTICSFENPHACATAVIIQGGKILLFKRNQEPHKGQVDLPGGYIQKNETPEQALQREIKEELGVNCVACTPMGSFIGKASYENFHYPVLDFAFLVQLGPGSLKLNKENVRIVWTPLQKVTDLAFTSNQKIVAHAQKIFNFDIGAMKKLVQQLDKTAAFDEQTIYKAALDGHVNTIVQDGKLVGMGWIFIRQTALRKQAVVEDMIVDEKQRGKGYGEKILRNLIAWAKKQGVDTIELTTNPKRVAANGLYKKVGFVLHETNHHLYKISK